MLLRLRLKKGAFSIEAPEYTPPAVLIEGEQASFRENEDLRLALNAEPPTELNGGEWQVSLQIEAFRDLKDVSLIFAVYPETACQIEIDSIEGGWISRPRVMSEGHQC